MAFDSATQGRSASPHPLPSLPPSPSEADLGRRGAWDEHEIDDGDDHNDDEYDELETEPRTPTAHSAQGRAPTSTQSKGKGSVRPLEATYADGGTDEALREIDGARGAAQEHYPPTTDGDAETRRIEETLRRWEIAERQRRKSARDSTAAAAAASAASSSPTTAAAPSVVADVARRASHLWASRSSRAPTAGVGAHHALHTSDDADADAVPLSTLAGPHVLSPPLPLSPTPSRPPTPPSAATLTPETENPFRDPYGSSSSLFVNAQPPASTPPSASGPGAGAKPGFAPPEPLGLPQPRTPPPRTTTPHANRPPEPMPPPALTRTGGRGARGGAPAGGGEEAGEKPVRWWTEWLCGCSEGPDRGGDAQAGRTNPLE